MLTAIRAAKHGGTLMGSDNPKLGWLVAVDPHLIEPPDVCLEADHPQGGMSRCSSGPMTAR